MRPSSVWMRRPFKPLIVSIHLAALSGPGRRHVFRIISRRNSLALERPEHGHRRDPGPRSRPRHQRSVSWNFPPRWSRPSPLKNYIHIIARQSFHQKTGAVPRPSRAPIPTLNSIRLRPIPLGLTRSRPGSPRSKETSSDAASSNRDRPPTAKSCAISAYDNKAALPFKRT